MVKMMSTCLTRGKVAKNALLVLVLFTLILTISPQNVLAEKNGQVNASEILENIEKGALVAEEDCTIIGDLDLSKINLSTIKVGGRELRKVNNSISIKNSIIKGNVNFNDIYFSGPVNFKESVFSGSTSFDNAIFDDKAKFSHAHFNYTTTFFNTTFNRESYFVSAKFNDWVQFDKANFSQKALFTRTRFNNGAQLFNVFFNNETTFHLAIFNGSTQISGTFNGTADFNSAVFNDVALLGYIRFNNGFSFYNTTFNSMAIFEHDKFENNTWLSNFEYADFNGPAEFNFVSFNEDIRFDHANFNSGVEFGDYTRFNENASFREASFTEVADFEDVRFMKDADFSNAEFNDEANFQNARFNDTAYFILAKFKDRAYFTNASFEDNADFSEADIFLTMKIRWSQLEGKLVYDDYFYQSLIRNFETLGQSEDANDAYYKYHVEKRKHIDIKSTRGFIRRPLEFIFLDLFCGYGVKPWWTVRTAICIIGVFSFFYWLIEVEGIRKRFWKFLKDLEKRLREFVDRRIKGKENEKSSSDSSLKDRCKRYWKRFLGFVFLSVSIFTTLGLLNNWKTAEDYETWFHFLAIMEALLGWLIMALFLISLTMTWIR